MDKIDVKDKFYIYQDEHKNYSYETKELYLKYLISLNDEIYDAYIELMYLYFEANKISQGYQIIDRAYNILLKKEFNNKLPDTLDYYELYNRDIFRLIYNYADALWITGNIEKALKIFKKIIRMHPNDNIGARYAVCGILENYVCVNHIWNVHYNDIEKWFNSKMKNHINKKGFGWLKTYIYETR